MILVIGDKHYPSVSIDQLSLAHVLTLQRELAITNVSSAKTFADVQGLIRDFSALPAAERANHPEAVFLSAVTIWATRVSAGESLTLLEAVDVPASSVRWVAEPHDRQVPAGKAPPRAAGANRRTSRTKSAASSQS